MRRREFIAALAKVVSLWPFAAVAEQATKIPVIGFLGAASDVCNRLQAERRTLLNDFRLPSTADIVAVISGFTASISAPEGNPDVVDGVDQAWL